MLQLDAHSKPQKKASLCQQDGSAGEGTCHQTGLLELNTREKTKAYKLSLASMCALTMCPCSALTHNLKMFKLFKEITLG